VGGGATLLQCGGRTRETGLAPGLARFENSGRGRHGVFGVTLRRRTLGDETISGCGQFAAASVLRRRCGARQGASPVSRVRPASCSRLVRPSLPYGAIPVAPEGRCCCRRARLGV